MSVDVFGREEFEKALTVALKGTDLKWQEVGYHGNELHYAIPVHAFSDLDNYVAVEINSTIRENGRSAGSGEDSIRAWLADADGQPLGNKVQRWVTRVPGWEIRLAAVLSKLLTMAEQINLCPTCGKIERVFIVKKDGPNKGRIFKKCCEVFVWLDEVDEDTPDCPDCGHPMVMRESKYGKFWGCRQFPVCRGTRTLKWNQGESKAKEDPYWGKITREYKEAKKAAQPEGKEAKKAALNEKLKSVLPPGRLESPMSAGTVTDSGTESLSNDDFEFEPSPFQQAIFDWVTNGMDGDRGRNLIVEAVAGSGKTTTGVKMLGLVPEDQKILFVAFNRHIAKELSKRAPRHVRVSTFHSLGYKAIRQTFGNVTVDERKVYRILDNYFDKKTQKHMYSPVRKLVSLVKANLTGVEAEDLSQLANYYGIDLDKDMVEIFQAFQYVMKRSLEMQKVINQIELVMLCVRDDTRVVACGDRYQSLYGFRGADVNAIPNLIGALSAETLPLSITYRNPKSIVTLVNDKFPHIPLEAAEWAIDGEIKDQIYQKALVEMAPGDMVLCRNNAPLVRPAFALIRNGIKAVIRGRDIGKGLLSLIRKMEVYDVSDLFLKLSEYENKEVTKLLVAEKNNQAQALQDRIDTIYAISDGCEHVFEVERKIEEVFSDEVEGVVFSTVHKAKGLEADNIFIIKPDLMPSSYAQSAWELQQEDNIMYVAYTRALKKLVFVREM
jgi:DNA helicase-2/ATP-dependent DNA helicase PcrA